MNSIPQTTDVIVPGQVLVLPIQALDKKSGPGLPWNTHAFGPTSSVGTSSVSTDLKLVTQASNEAPSPPVEELLWSGPGAVVQHTTTAELANLMDTADSTKQLDQDLIVVAYMPQCKHCRDLEPVVRPA